MKLCCVPSLNDLVMRLHLNHLRADFEHLDSAPCNLTFNAIVCIFINPIVNISIVY